MKPTKEQLADLEWWDENTKPEDKYCLIGEFTGGCYFSNHINSGGGYTVLAKRPKAKWEPEPMQICEINFPLHSWTKIQFIGMNSDGYFVCECMNGELEKFKADDIEFRPLKTQREEFIDRAARASKHFGIHLADIMGELYDAGCRFELTEKDGE
uniref:Uncharacterized protein n=1 Tax=uncultured marine virus TaxID=186617 RepID=A0A0F7L449_9VIRU|nr:hypothetical protein [uncultured marine virus]